MASDRRAAGLTVLRISLGVFFLFEGLGKIRWLGNASLLTTRLTEWSGAVPPSSWAGRYLAAIALPYSSYFARLVPLGELASGIAMITGIWTPLFAFIAFFMALNFEFASGTLFKYAWLTNPYGPPVLGGTLALALGGARLPLSLQRGAPVRAAKAARS